jgi:hypothetical protein
MNARHPARPALVATLLSSVLVLGACSTAAPVVYSEKRQTLDIDARTRNDIAQCSQQADTRIGRNGANARQAAAKSGQVAGVGFVATAVGSLVATSRGAWDRARGAAAGGAAGMATKLLLEWNEPDDVYQAYVERCLQSRGHEVLGWR